MSEGIETFRRSVVSFCGGILPRLEDLFSAGQRYGPVVVSDDQATGGFGRSVLRPLEGLQRTEDGPSEGEVAVPPGALQIGTVLFHSLFCRRLNRCDSRRNGVRVLTIR